jgi:hypothetical protein
MNAPISLAGSRWTQRPPDQRHASVEALLERARARKARGETRSISVADLRAAPSGDGGIALHVGGETLLPTPFAASQLSRWVGLPPKAVQVLSPALGAAALNERIAVTAAQDERRPWRALVEPSGSGATRLRALTSPQYARAWDADLIERLLLPLLDEGWSPATASSRPGAVEAGLFSSDRDLFCFLVHPGDAHRLRAPHGRPMQRGLIVRNSEVGGVALRLRAFWFDSFCTNHMVFGAVGALDLSVAHRRGERSPLDRLSEAWATAGGTAALARDTEVARAVAERAQACLLAPWSRVSRDTLRDTVEAFGERARRARVRRRFTTRLLREGPAVAARMADPRGPGVSLWAMACGVTEAVQSATSHQDVRMGVDAAVGRVLQAVA